MYHFLRCVTHNLFWLRKTSLPRFQHTGAAEGYLHRKNIYRSVYTWIMYTVSIHIWNTSLVYCVLLFHTFDRPNWHSEIYMWLVSFGEQVTLKKKFLQTDRRASFHTAVYIPTFMGFCLNPPRKFQGIFFTTMCPLTVPFLVKFQSDHPS